MHTESDRIPGGWGPAFVAPPSPFAFSEEEKRRLRLEFAPLRELHDSVEEQVRQTYCSSASSDAAMRHAQELRRAYNDQLQQNPAYRSISSRAWNEAYRRFAVKKVSSIFPPRNGWPGDEFIALLDTNPWEALCMVRERTDPAFVAGAFEGVLEELGVHWYSDYQTSPFREVYYPVQEAEPEGWFETIEVEDTDCL